MEQGSWQRHHRTNRPEQPATPRRGCLPLGTRSSLTSRRRRCCTCRLFFAMTLSMGMTFALFAAEITSVVLAVLRLSRQDYVDPADQSDSDHKSIRGSLNLFYGLVLAQGVSSFLAYTMISIDLQRVLKLRMTYQLGHSWLLIIKRYMLDTYMKCLSGSVREAMDMDLVSFAMEMARSTSVADRLVGVRVLDRVLSVDKYKGLALMRLRASSDTVGNVIGMLGLKNKTTEEENARGHAANVVLELSPDLQVESFPAMLQMVTSLLTVKTTAASSTTSNVSIELTWFGVKILKKTMDNPDNCKEVAKDADDQVISSIVDLTAVSNGDRSSSISWSPVAEEIIVEAVQVLHRLVRTTGDAGRALRRKISENLHVLRNMRKIMEHPGSHTELLTEAIGVLACLALEETGKEEIGSSPRVIRKLVPYLVVETPSAPSNRVELAKSAVEALLVLAVDSQRIALRILEELKIEGMQQLVDILSSDSTELRTMSARLLEVLRASSTAEHARYNRTVDNALPLLLKAIKLEVEKLDALVPAGEHGAHDDNLEEWRTKQGALLESFVGLSVQICTSIQASEFGDALRNANLTVDLLMHKLNRILALYKSADTAYPGIRRVTVELIIWMLHSNRRCIEFFLEHRVDRAVKEVAETEERLEMFKTFFCGIGVAKHGEPVSSLVASALPSIARRLQGEVSAENTVPIA